MDLLSVIRQPIEPELSTFVSLFNEALTHSDGLLSQALNHIRRRGGKRMRPMLILLMAKHFGRIDEVTHHAAIGLELLHTASLVHDDVVDESAERRGQKSVNASYDNKVAVLVGDYILSTALLHVSMTGNQAIVEYLARLGRTLSAGEILQLSNIQNQEISEDVYYEVIRKKTAALFEACASIGALAAGASEEEVALAAEFGQNLGIIFQIRDDIFDYYPSSCIGKPTGNDMAEGKLTLPVIYALNQHPESEMLPLAKKVKDGTVTPQEIAQLVDYTKRVGGIEYAENRMETFRQKCLVYIAEHVSQQDISQALKAYVDFVMRREI